MQFFDDKEEVIHFELTSYGRHLLSLGRLKPHYYAFYDDDVIYDISHQKDNGGTQLSETQAEIKQRILKNTPYLKTQSNYYGLDRKILAEETYLNFEEIRYPSNEEKANYLNYPIGTTDPLSVERSPSWQLTYLHGSTLEGTSSNVSKYLESKEVFSDPTDPRYNPDARLSGSLPFKNIPQLEMVLEHQVSVRNIYNDDSQHTKEVSANLPISEIKSDGSYISVQEEQILIHFLEKHGFSHKDSFTIEVFMYDDVAQNKYIPLEFEKRAVNRLPDFDPSFQGADMPEVETGEFAGTGESYPVADSQGGMLPEIGEKFVEYYFDLRVDRDVPEEDVCDGLMKLKREDIFLDLDYDCIEKEMARDINIYNTGVTDIEDCE